VTITVGSFEDEPAVTIRAGELETTFLPELGMLGASLRHEGDELLALPKGLSGYRAGHVAGLPLLAPWANRLGGRRYDAAGVAVNLEGLTLHTDDNGLPIHGTMTAQPGWELVRAEAGDDTAELHVRFEFAARPDLLASFPFPHTLDLEARLEPGALSVTTSVTPTGDRPVPIAFGWHPYFRLGNAQRRSWTLALPRRRHLLLDSAGLPTGGAAEEQAEEAPIADRTFDDLYALEDERQLSLAAGGRRVTVVYGDGYPFAQVFAPPGQDFACLEPMTAPTNSLVSGGYPLAEPGRSFSAAFSITVTAL
jgi:galactose mutarotase-like enzyme